MAASIINVTCSKFLPKNCLRSLFCKRQTFKNQVRLCSSTTEDNQTNSSPDGEEYYTEEEIMRLRNFSNLKPTLFRREKGLAPKQKYLERMTFKNNDERKSFMRRLYAKYGEASSIDPSVCWPSKQQLESTKLDEQLLEPTFQQMMTYQTTEKQNELKFNKELRERVEKSMAKMDGLFEEFEKKKGQRLEKAKESAAKMLAMLDEAEEYYGYPVQKKSVDFKNFMKMKREEKVLAKKKAKKEKRKAIVSAKLQQELEA